MSQSENEQYSSQRQLAGKVAVVTGGSSGLGLAFTEHLVDAGAHVVVAALPGSGVHERVAALQSRGARVTGIELDVADLSAVEELGAVAAALGPLHIWVNNAGASGIYGPAHQHPVLVFERVVDANIRGVFHGTRTAIRLMLPRGEGHVVNVWGKGAAKPTPMQSIYGSSKAWNRAFTRAVREELKGSGVQVHGYDPGLVLTDMLAQVTVAPGQEKRVKALPYVAGLWGQSPAEAAAALVPMLLQEKRDHLDLTPATVLGRGVRSVLSGRLRATRRMRMRVTTLPTDET